MGVGSNRRPGSRVLGVGSFRHRNILGERREIHMYIYIYIYICTYVHIIHICIYIYIERGGICSNKNLMRSSFLMTEETQSRYEKTHLQASKPNIPKTLEQKHVSSPQLRV